MLHMLHIPFLPERICCFTEMTPRMTFPEITTGSRGEAKLKGGAAYLSISSNGASTVTEQLRHVVVAGEFPQARLQVEVSVESQCAGSPEGGAVLVRGHLADHFWVSGGFGEEAVAGRDLAVVQQIGAAMVANAGTIRAQCELKVRQRSGGHYGQHT